METSLPLAGRVALISGGLGDIGSAIARAFAAHGAAVAIADLAAAAVAAPLLASLRQHGTAACYDVVDVRSAEAVAAWVSRVEGSLGVPDLIIPNAAIVTPADFQTLTPIQWSEELRVNLDGAFHLAHYATARLRHHQRPGRVVFIGSWAGHAPHSHIPAYCVSKAGLRMLMQCLALELAPHDILVNEVAPGYVDAGLSGRIFQTTPGAREEARQRVPAQRLITPEEVAHEVLHLCHPHTRHTTGSVALMDGGLSLRVG